MGESVADIDVLSVDDLKKLVVEVFEANAALRADNAVLREEIARLKGLKGRPRLRPSGMEPRDRATVQAADQAAEGQTGQARHPRGSGDHGRGAGRFALQGLRGVRRAGVGHPPAGDPLPPRALAHPGGETLVAALPAWVEGHFGPALKRYVLAQYHQGQVTVPRLTIQLNDLGRRISKRHVVRLLTMGKEGFRDEAIGVARAPGWKRRAG